MKVNFFIKHILCCFMKIKMYEVYANLNKIMACTLYVQYEFVQYIYMYNASLVEKYIKYITRSVNREDDKIGKY